MKRLDTFSTRENKKKIERRKYSSWVMWELLPSDWYKLNFDDLVYSDKSGVGFTVRSDIWALIQSYLIGDRCVLVHFD